MMDNLYKSFDELKKLYPNEWMLLGDPEMKNTSVLSGFVLFHSKHKKKVCYIVKNKTADYLTVTIAFAGDLKQHRKTGLLKRI